MTLVDSNVIQGAMGASQIASLEAQYLINRGFLPGIYKRYGQLFGLHDILTAANNVVSISAQDHKVVEEKALVRVLKIKNAVTATSGNLTVELDDENFANPAGTTGTSVARVGFWLYVPQKYMPAGVTEDRPYRIQAIGNGDRANSSLTLAPITLTGTSKTATSLAADLPAGTYLTIGHSSWARGGTGPVGLKDYPVYREYKTGFIRDAQEFDGAFISHQGETVEIDGRYLRLDPILMKAELRLKDQKESAVIWSEENDNPNLTQTSTFGSETDTVRSTRGLFPWLDLAGQKLYYSDGGDFNIFDQIIDSLVSQGVYTKTATVFCAPRFAQMITKIGHDYIREYSGGSNLWDAATGKIGFTPTVIEYGNMTFFIHVVASFAKPASYGFIDSDNEAQYVAGNAAVVVPDAKVTVNKWGEQANVTIPNMWMGYVNYNGEDRTNMIGRIKGLNGVFEGIDIVSEADGFKYCWGSEFAFGGAEWNKMVFLRKSIAKA